MTAITQPVTSPAQGIVATTISEGAPSLFRPLVNIVMQYMFQEPKSWITEWTEAHGCEVVTDALVKAETPLTFISISLVVQYLQKPDIYGLKGLEDACGKEELTKLLGGPCAPQLGLPLDIDEEMQTDLTTLWDKETLAPFATITKVTELFSLYYQPKGMTANIAEALAKKHGTQFREYRCQPAIREHGNTATQADSWILFSNDILGPNETFEEHQALIPAGFEIPDVGDGIFCVFRKYISTKTRILTDVGTHTQQQTKGSQVAIGYFNARGLRFAPANPRSNYYNVGVAPLRKVYVRP